MRLVVCLVIGSLGCGSQGGRAPGLGAATYGGAPVDVLPSDDARFVVSVWTWPSPLVRGASAVRLGVADATGAPAEGLTVDATPWMPAHGHGTSVVPSVTSNGDGTYDVDPLLLFMTGRWELNTRLGPDAGDSVVIPLDVH